MLLRSFEPPNLPFPACMLSIRIASMLFTCCFEASNLPILHSRPVCYLYVLSVCYLHAASKLRTSQSSIPGQYAIYMYSQYGGPSVSNTGASHTIYGCMTNNINKLTSRSIGDAILCCIHGSLWPHVEHVHPSQPVFQVVLVKLCKINGHTYK